MPNIKVKYTKEEKLNVLSILEESPAITYWAIGGAFKQNDDGDTVSFSIRFTDEKDELRQVKVTSALIQKGVDEIFKGNLDCTGDTFKRIAVGENDSDSADVILQYAIFGDCIFG